MTGGSSLENSLNRRRGLTGRLGRVALAVALVTAAGITLRDMAAPLMAAPPAPVLDTPVGGDDWLAAQRTFPHDTLDLGALRARAIAQVEPMRARAVAVEWKGLGPNTIGGRITDLAVDPIRPNTVYAASAGGGVWRSTDAGASFAPSWPPTIPQAVGALAVSADGTLFAGTGETNPGGGSVTFPGAGVFRSTDGGENWESIGLAETHRVGRIMIDPTNPKRIFVAASGNIFVPGGERGVYLSEDNGTTWTRVLSGATPTTGAADLAINPREPNIVYAAMWDHHRTPGTRPYGGEGSGLYRSADGGRSWNRLEGGPPAAGPTVGRIAVAVAPSNPNTVYTSAIDASGGMIGFWVSTNKGDSWTKAGDQTLTGSTGGFGWWFGRIYVDPRDDQHLFHPGLTHTESTNGGRSWRAGGAGVHADQHALAWDPKSPDRVYLGNDGGVYTSTSNGATTGGWSKTSNLGGLQFYSVAVSARNPDRIAGGLQDNGSVRSWANWSTHLGGDGLANVIDPTNDQKIYACSQDGFCSRSTNGGNSMTRFGQATASRFGWLAPVVLDPNNPSIVYWGGDRLNRSTDSAASFQAISPDLTHGKPPGSTRWANITTVSVAKSDSRTLYVGTDDGRVWITRDLGAHWSEISAGLPKRWVTRVAADPTDPATAYVTVSGYTSGETGAHVFRTTDAGRSWTSIAEGLPNSPVNDVVLDPRDRTVLYLATDVGVFTTRDNGANWAAVGTGLPTVPVMDLDLTVHADRLHITAATFGQGIHRAVID